MELVPVSGALTNRGLLRAVLLAFALLLAYRFVATVAAVAMLLATGLLLAVALSAPVEALHRRKVPRLAAVAAIVAVILAGVGFGGYLLLPTLATQAQQLASSLPEAFSQLVERARDLAQRLGVTFGGGGGISPSTLASAARRVLGGLLGLFSGLASFLTGLIVVLFVPCTWRPCRARWWAGWRDCSRLRRGPGCANPSLSAGQCCSAGSAADSSPCSLWACSRRSPCT
jgi:predicted PurR-regulated permease PerM